MSGFGLGGVADGMSGVRIAGTLVFILHTRRNVERYGALDWTLVSVDFG